MPLKGVKPEKIEKRLKMFLFGPPGVGKTTASIMFPHTYICDCEKGTENYSESISKAGSAIFRSNNPDEIRAELKTLLTEKHPYRTVLIDPITQVYNALQEKWTPIFEKHAKTEKEAETQDFGLRYWGKVKSDYKVLLRMLMALDTNVIVTSHQKDVYGPGMQKIGVGPDSMRGDEYIFDLVFQLSIKGGKRVATTLKERAEIGKNKFPSEFEWSYENFLKFYGKEVIEREAKPVEMATAEQVAKIRSLVELVRVDDETINRWMTKCDVDSWEEMKGEEIQKCIDHMEAKLTPATKGAK